jgi:hypothetical protein
MGNTRFDLTSSERKVLESLGATYPERINRIADYLRQHGSEVKIGRPYAPTTSVHIAFDDRDWQEILNWMVLFGDTKSNQLHGRKTTKKDLVLHVAQQLLAGRRNAAGFITPTDIGTVEQRRASIRLTIRRLRRRLKRVDIWLAGLKMQKDKRRRRWFERARARYRAERKNLIAEIQRLKLDMLE